MSKYLVRISICALGGWSPTSQHSPQKQGSLSGVTSPSSRLLCGGDCLQSRSLLESSNEETDCPPNSVIKVVGRPRYQLHANWPKLTVLLACVSFFLRETWKDAISTPTPGSIADKCAAGSHRGPNRASPRVVGSKASRCCLQGQWRRGSWYVSVVSARLATGIGWPISLTHTCYSRSCSPVVAWRQSRTTRCPRRWR